MWHTLLRLKKLCIPNLPFVVSANCSSVSLISLFLVYRVIVCYIVLLAFTSVTIFQTIIMIISSTGSCNKNVKTSLPLCWGRKGGHPFLSHYSVILHEYGRMCVYIFQGPWYISAIVEGNGSVSEIDQLMSCTSIKSVHIYEAKQCLQSDLNHQLCMFFVVVVFVCVWERERDRHRETLTIFKFTEKVSGKLNNCNTLWCYFVFIYSKQICMFLRFLSLLVQSYCLPFIVPKALFLRHV